MFQKIVSHWTLDPELEYFTKPHFLVTVFSDDSLFKNSLITSHKQP